MSGSLANVFLDSLLAETDLSAQVNHEGEPCRPAIMPVLCATEPLNRLVDSEKALFRRSVPVSVALALRVEQAGVEHGLERAQVREQARNGIDRDLSNPLGTVDQIR